MGFDSFLVRRVVFASAILTADVSMSLSVDVVQIEKTCGIVLF
jgi:hypothetical protein